MNIMHCIHYAYIIPCYNLENKKHESSFNLKDQASHVLVLSVVYEGKYDCRKNYIGETGQNISAR